MKKFIILASLAIMFSVPLLAQQVKKHVILVIPTAATAFGEEVKKYDFVYIIADSTLYVANQAFGRNTTGTIFKATRTNYTVANVGIYEGLVNAQNGTFTGTITVTGAATLGSTADITGNTTVGGTLVVTGNATTNGVLGVKAQTATQDHVNRLVFNNSVKATDTLFVGSAQHIMQTTTNKLKTEGSFGVTDTLGVGTAQWIRQVSTNRLGIEGSLATGASDTLATGVVTSATVKATGVVSSSDTTGFRFKAADGTWYRMWISPTGVVGTATTTTP